MWNKKSTCAKFLATNPTLSGYDEKMTYYGELIKEIDDLEDYKTIHCFAIKVFKIILN